MAKTLTNEPKTSENATPKADKTPGVVAKKLPKEKKEPAPKKEVKNTGKAKPKVEATIDKFSSKAKKQSNTKTLIGGKKEEIQIHPKIRRMTSHGQIVESKTAVVVFGRMNPPTIGHQRLITEALEIALEHDGHAMLFTTSTNNAKNPLTNSQKMKHITEAFGDDIDVRSEVFSNPITLLQALAESFDNLIWVTGEDQAADYNRIVESYNGKDFYFSETTVVSLSRQGSTISENISATRLRQAVAEGDIVTFRKGLPVALQDSYDTIYEQVADGMALNSSGNPLINSVREALINGQ